MNILVVNGSPKGPNSITVQSIRYIEALRGEKHSFSYLNAGPMLRKLEKDFSAAAAELGKADLVIFSYPVYTFLAPFQLHRFIELVKDSGIDLKDKWATQYTTSKHFYDVTAHEFVRENILDLGMKYLEGLSQDMEDLLSKDGRTELDDWASMTSLRIERAVFEQRTAARAESSPRAYMQCLSDKTKRTSGRISIVTNASADDTPLMNMIEDFRHALTIPSVVYNIKDFPFSGGCISCFSCASSGKCIHKDGFDDYLRNEIQKADSIVYAFRIKNHFTDSSMKCYDDRQFCNGHRPVTAGTPTAYLVAGDLEAEPNLQMLIKGRAGVGGNYLAAIVTDETDGISKRIENAAASLEVAIDNHIKGEKNFYGVGGSKIFRDLIYEMRGLMRADHKYYKKHGYYSDLPQKHKGKIIMMYLVGLLTKLPGAEKKKGMMTKGMLAPYEKVLAKAKEGR